MVEILREGKRTYGAFLPAKHGLIYCAFRRPADMFLDGKAGEFMSIADAMRDGKAAWAVDERHLRLAQMKGCYLIAIWVRKLGWVFMTPIESFFDRDKFYRRSYASRGGSDQRYLPLQHFITHDQKIKLGPIRKV